MIMKRALEKKLRIAIQSLFANQPNIFEFTSETGQTEWNLAHHLANEIHDLLPDYDCDLDVIKENFGNRRPDIIFHARGNHKNNFLVVELKRGGSRAELDHDLHKIQAYWFGGNLNYKFGAVINIRSDKTYEVVVLENH